MYYLIRDLNQDEKPREKLLKFGPSNLTDVELLAIILRSGGKNTSALDLARQILGKHGGLEKVSQVDVQQLQQIKHINVAKACSIVAAIEFGIRTQNCSSNKPSKIVKPHDVYKIMKQTYLRLDKECLYLLSLTSRNHLVAKDLISVGTVNEAMLSPREIFRQAFIRNAVNFIIVHNHPSEDPTPSNEDIEATLKLYAMSQQLGITLLDHIIITKNNFCSLKQLNLIGKKKGGEKSEK